MSRLPTERELLRRIELLPREVAPKNDAWLNISARISANSRDLAEAARRRPVWPFAAAAALLLMTGIMMMSGQMRNATRSLDAPGQLDQSDLAQFYPSVGTSAASKAEYQGAFREFMRLGKPSPSALQHSFADFGPGWNALREAEVELKVALSQEPDSVFLNAHMQALRARQLELLQQISAAEMTVWRNTI